MSLDPAVILPKELNLEILFSLDSQALSRCCQVSKLWQKLASEDVLWKKLYPQIDFPSNTRPKEYLDTHAVTTIDEVLERTQQFANKVKLYQKGIFTCSFPLDTKCTIIAEVGYGFDSDGLGSENEPTADYHIKETCLFMKALPPTQIITGSHSANRTNNSKIFSCRKSGKFKSTIVTSQVTFRAPYSKSNEIKTAIEKILSHRIEQLKIVEKRIAYATYLLGATAILGLGLALNSHSVDY